MQKVNYKKHAGKFRYQKMMGKILENHIHQDIIDSKNADRSWKRGYNKEHDVVVVSKDGTVGEIYQLQNLAIALPMEPEDKTTIRFHDEHYVNQYWKPYDIPKELLNIEKETVDWNSRKENKNNPKTPTEIFYMKPKKFITKYEKFINDEFDKRENGLWVYINLKAVWIPPSHYYMLQYNTVKGVTNPDFRFTNRDYYLFWEACRADPRSLGMIYLKNRRSGASTMAGSEALNLGSQMNEGFVGIMSKTNRDSVSFLNRMVIRPFKKTPWYFKPQTSGTTSATSGLNFKEVASKISAKNTTMTADEGLDTSIRQFSTSLNSMDGERVDFMVLDEAGKYQSDTPFDQYWSIAEECLTEGFQVVGKAMVVSTANAQAKGGKEFKDIYYASDVRKRGSSGRTASGLYSLFIPGEFNQAGGYDIYGYSIVDSPRYSVKNQYGQIVKIGNLNRLIEKGKELKKKSAVLYNEFLRKHPRTEAHAFRDESAASDFDLNKIYEQMDSNEMLVKVPYERGNFVNVADEGYDIQWRPNKYGKFYVSWMPPEELRNNFVKRGGKLHPLNNFGCFGVDPYKVSQTADGRGSKGAMHFVTGKSMNVQEVPYEEFVLEYLERPLTVEMYLRDMFYAMLFYGSPALIESNVPNLLEYLDRRGATHFALRRKDKLRLTLDEKKIGGIPMTGEKVRQDHYFAIQTYIINHVGESDDSRYRDVGTMGHMPFNRTLSSWSKFTPLNRTSEDASISSGLALMGVAMMSQKVVRGANESKKAVPFMKKYRY